MYVSTAHPVLFSSTQHLILHAYSLLNNSTYRLIHFQSHCFLHVTQILSALSTRSLEGTPAADRYGIRRWEHAAAGLHWGGAAPGHGERGDTQWIPCQTSSPHPGRNYTVYVALLGGSSAMRFDDSNAPLSSSQGISAVPFWQLLLINYCGVGECLGERVS